MLLCARALANNPPAAPVITEPSTDGRIVNSEDVHMETGPMSDPDPGNTHAASDWEIWQAGAAVWAAPGVTGALKVHIHLGDGSFQGTHAGRTSLLPDVNYSLRVRHKDSSGDPVTQWSVWSVRTFRTASLSSVFPMELEDVAATPVPTLEDTQGNPARLPAGSAPAWIALENPAGGPVLLRVTGSTGPSNAVSNPGPLASHADVRVRAFAGSGALFLPETNLSFTDEHGADHTIFLPALNLAPNQTSLYWVSTNGATYTAQPGQTQPDFSSIARGAPVPWEMGEAGYRVEVVATGFQLPVNIAFVPSPGPAATDPLFYVTELYGRIKVVFRNGTVGTYTADLLNYGPTGIFPGSGEQGLTGLCVDPVSGDLFATMVYSTTPPIHELYPKVMRFHSTDGGRTASSRLTILNMAGESQGPSHQISNLSIWQGKLYVHVGDGFEWARAQNLDSFQGKVLRMNLDGSAALDNPMYNAADGITSRDYIYAWGFRNPFGGAWREADGMHYEVEPGPEVDRFAQVVRGRNYLWGITGTNPEMANFAIYNWDPARAPVNIAFLQPGSFGGSRFPASKQGHAFITESGGTYATGFGKWITEWVLDGAGNLVGQPTQFCYYNGSGKASCIGLAAGPDGLYFTDMYKDTSTFDPPVATEPGANVLRIRWVGKADFKASVLLGLPPLTVRFTDTSDVPTPTSWVWSFGDGTTSTQHNPTHIYQDPGTYDVRLSVTGAAGAVAVQKQALITVDPVPTIAVLRGTVDAGPADHALADHLRSLGFSVHEFYDLPSARPSAADMSTWIHLAVALPTVNAANIATEWRTARMPLVFMAPGLLSGGQEPMTTGGSTVTGATAVDLSTVAHQITSGLSGRITVFSPSASMSVAGGVTGPGVTVLARRADFPDDIAFMVAEEGAALLGGVTTPARLAFLLFGPGSFSSATPSGRDLLNRVVCWSVRGIPQVYTQPQPVTVAAGGTAVLSFSAAAAGPATLRWQRNGLPLNDGGRISGATTRTLTITGVVPADAGQYTCAVACPCGSLTTASAMLTVTGGQTCYPNCDGSTAQPVLNVADFSCFIARFAAADPYANCDGSTTPPVLNIFDFVCFQQRFAAGCP